MSHITTYSGEDFDPIHPDASKIHIKDIAHALSMMCRANGHFSQFYSVGQHCVNCAVEAQARGYSKKVQLGCLLHDASEAYIADITRPVKPFLLNYMDIEQQLQDLIYQKYLTSPLSSEEVMQVKQIDDLMLVCEFNALMRKPVFDYQPNMASHIHLELESFESVCQKYLDCYAELYGKEAESSFEDSAFLSVGIDGCKGKWLCVAISRTGCEVNLFDHIREVCEHYEPADSILIDMPIGLPENANDMRPDAALRKALKGKASSVFNVPCRQAIYQAEYEKASATNHEIMGKKLSKQSFAILPKIKEVDLFLQTNPAWKNHLLESHPEYCFSLLNSGLPVIENKQTAEGMTKRLSLLQQHYPNSCELLNRFKMRYPTLASKNDDLLDALVLAVVGKIGLKKGFYTIPDIPLTDEKAIKMQIIGANL